MRDLRNYFMKIDTAIFLDSSKKKRQNFRPVFLRKFYSFDQNEYLQTELLKDWMSSLESLGVGYIGDTCFIILLHARLFKTIAVLQNEQQFQYHIILSFSFKNPTSCTQFYDAPVITERLIKDLYNFTCQETTEEKCFKFMSYLIQFLLNG